MAPDDDNPPAFCGSVPASDDGVAGFEEVSPVPGDDGPVPVEDSSAPGDAPAPGKDTPASVDDAPAVVDDLSSSKGQRAAVVCPGLVHVGAPARPQWLPRP